jgi:hypothetical protein
MKALYIGLGIGVFITGILTIAGVTEVSQETAGIYMVCLGIMVISEGLRAWENK